MNQESPSSFSYIRIFSYFRKNCNFLSLIPDSNKKRPNSSFLIPDSARTASSSGYIAITSAIIVTIIVISAVLTTSSTGYFARFNVLGTLLKEESNALANACADTALLNLAFDINYAGNETIMIASSTCTIMTIETNGDEKTIKTQATENDRTANLKVILDTTDFTIVSWDEVASF